MSSAEQTVTWLISLGVLESPKKSVSDPEAFLRAALRDGVALCRLLERLVPGSVQRIHQEPKSEAECLNNIKEFLKACGALRVETFDANDLYQGLNFNKVLSSLVTLNKVTADIGVGSDSVCARHQSHQIKSADSFTGAHLSLGRTSKNFPGKYRSLDMSDNSKHHMVVKAKFNFYQTNEDELCFNKGDIIHVTRIEEGGWWEGSLNGKNGWFPSNYVREIKLSEKPASPKSATLKSSPKGFETPPVSKSYYNVVLQNILDTECDYAEELTMLLSTFLRPLQASDKLSVAEVTSLMGNLEDIYSFQQSLVQSLEDCTKLPESQQKVGGCFANLMSQMKSLYLAYCANHPWAVNVLTEHSEELGEFMEMKGATSPGILMLTTSLSKPFMRLDKYPTLLKELERHMEESHPDWPDIQRAMTAFKSLSSQCQEVRKRKELELQILTETVHGWEGEDIRSLGNVIYMSQVMVQSGNEEKCERYFLLFPHVLLMLSASPRMSGFIYQGKLPLTGLTVTKLEDSDENKNSFEITGSMIERILVSCSNYQDMQEWADHLQKQTKAPSVGVVRQQSMPCHTLPLHPVTPLNKHSDGYPISVTPPYHTLPHPSLHGTSHSTLSWGPLEPPKMPKPWTLSCLRPAAPLKPSAALCYKEDLSRSPKTMKKLLPKRKPERKPSDEEFALRKSTAALEEDAQILKVIEAYCTSAKTRQTLNSTWQGTDLMHNHVLSDDDLSSLDSARRSSLSRLEPADLSEDSDYDSIWLAHSYRTVSTSRCRKESAPQVLLPEEEKMIVEETNSNGQTIIEEKTLVDTVYALKDEMLELKQESKKMWCSLEEEQRARKELEKLIRKVLKNRNEFSWDETNL
ncbi:rho guanine nucleotide exchange factor 7-like isoform X6 [Mobula birostris]|uniref:rho guanine nucleotide exchange factor 7-like isoform X6 n=1 Tax=Mobula birostris TaxID=1983395 RepID=UPI003B2829C9